MVGGRVDRVLLAAAAGVVVVAGLRAAATLIAPIVLALVLVVAVSPIQYRLRRRGCPGWLATTLLLVAMYGLIAVSGLILVASIGRLAGLVPRYTDAAEDLAAAGIDWLGGLGVTPDEAQALLQKLDPGSLVGLAGSLIGSLAGVLSNLVFLFALLFFMAAEASGYPRRMRAIARARPAFARALWEFARGTRRYLLVATVFGLIVAALDGVALWLMGVPLPLLWALLAFITNYIPNVGFVIGLLPPALLALLEGGPGLLLLVIVVYSVINFVLQSLIQPKVIGASVDLSSTVTFLALVFWAWVLGGLGALLAVPLTLLAKALLIDAAEQTRWVGNLVAAKSDDGRDDDR